MALKKERFAVTGMTCSACSARVEKAVTALAGTEKVSVNLLTNSMQLSYDEGKLTPAQIIAAVEQAGYGASLKGEKVGQIKGQDDPLAKEVAAMKMRLVWSVAFLVPVTTTSSSARESETN
jgi:Cu+-exporting ATPase